MPGIKGKTGRKFSNETIIEAFRQCKFHKGETAELLGISRQWLYKLIDQQDELKEEIEAAQEFVLDKAEKALEELVEAKNFQAIKFTLETRGKKRGYGNSLELTGDATKPITLVTSEMSPEAAARAYLDTIKPDVDDL